MGNITYKFKAQQWAPAYANLFMGNLEPTLQELSHNHIKLWKRFIDDIFIVWIGSKELIEFMEKINKIHPTIHFTFELSESEITFLDVTLLKGNRFKSEHILDKKPTSNPRTNNYMSTLRPTTHQLLVINSNRRSQQVRQNKFWQTTLQPHDQTPKEKTETEVIKLNKLNYKSLQ